MHGNVLAVVSSTGSLSFFKLSVSEKSPAFLEEMVTHKPLGNDDGVLFLSCAWHPSITHLLAITTSNYEVHILHVDESSWNVHRAITKPVMVHTLEAWTVAFSTSVPKYPNSSEGKSAVFPIYSGGDDSKLLVSSCECHLGQINDDADLIEVPYPAISIKGHGAGVTAILPLDLQSLSSVAESVVVTGSYDDHIRVYAINDRNSDMPPYGPRLLAEHNLHGGVWRLKLITIENTTTERGADINGDQHWRALILAPCMHAGSRIVEITGTTASEAKLCEIKVLGRFEEHESMNYGSDFQPGSGGEGGKLRCVSTSFYDRLLCLWDYE